MRITRLGTILGACLLYAVSARAADYPAPVEGDFVAHGFTFASGETLPELKLHYRTIGTPRRNASGIVENAVLILHGTGGTGRSLLTPTFAGELFGAGQLLDATRYFIVLPDDIGHGQSSKPSDGLHARFPHYNYDDMVRAQHVMLTDGLEVNHLRLALGTSMGAMQCWVWGEMYPGFVDGLVPLASAPTQIAGRNRVMRKMMMDSITSDPTWKNGEYTQEPHEGLVGAINLLLLMTSSPLQWQKQAPTRDGADTWYADQIRTRVAATDANDMLYQFDSSRDYDPSPNLEQITAPLLAINSADDVVNPPELGLMEKLMPRVKHGRYILIPTSDRTRGHGTHSLPRVWGNYLREFLDGLPAQSASYWFRRPLPATQSARRRGPRAARLAAVGVESPLRVAQRTVDRIDEHLHLPILVPVAEGGVGCLGAGVMASSAHMSRAFGIDFSASGLQFCWRRVADVSMTGESPVTVTLSFRDAIFSSTFSVAVNPSEISMFSRVSLLKPVSS